MVDDDDAGDDSCERGDGCSHAMPPRTSDAYLQPAYWNERFSVEKHYEWFKDYSHFRHLVQAHINISDCVLELGCGNSTLSEDMYKDGFTHITSTDLSPVAIKLKQDRCAAMGLDGMRITVADIFNLPFSDGKFDVVIEKGLMDSLFVNSGDPWNPLLETKERVTTMLKEAHRVLKPTGVFISIAFGQPHFRRSLFEVVGFSWSMQHATFGTSFHYFFYMLRKGTKSLDAAYTFPLVQDSVAKTDLVQEQMDNEDYLLSVLIESD